MLTRRPPTPLARTLEALKLADGARESRSARKRRRALAALIAARAELDRRAAAPTSTEAAVHGNHSTARQDVLSTALTNAIIDLETPS